MDIILIKLINYQEHTGPEMLHQLISHKAETNCPAGSSQIADVRIKTLL